MDKSELEDFLKQRDEALLSLDKEKITAFAELSSQRKVTIDDNIFWAGVHYARLGVVYFSEEVKQVSRQWLKENGFSF